MAEHSACIGQNNKAGYASLLEYGSNPCKTMVRKFEENDKGRNVLAADGTVIGNVQAVAGDVAHVTPDNDLDSSIRQKIGWMSGEQDVYELPHSSVENIDDLGIHLE